MILFSQEVIIFTACLVAFISTGSLSWCLDASHEACVIKQNWFASCCWWCHKCCFGFFVIWVPLCSECLLSHMTERDKSTMVGFFPHKSWNYTETLFCPNNVLLAVFFFHHSCSCCEDDAITHFIRTLGYVEVKLLLTMQIHWIWKTFHLACQVKRSYHRGKNSCELLFVIVTCNTCHIISLSQVLSKHNCAMQLVVNVTQSQRVLNHPHFYEGVYKRREE